MAENSAKEEGKEGGKSIAEITVGEMEVKDTFGGKSISSASVLPELVVLDLDACTWMPEMYQLDILPTAKDAIRGDLGNGAGVGVVAVKSGRETIRLFPGALFALQSLIQGSYGDRMRFAVASSADTPRAVQIGREAMNILEVLPGITLRQVLGHCRPPNFEGNLQVGRSSPLSSNKAATHFPILQRECQVPYDRMLFFDDCNWTDHVAAVSRAHGVVAHATPAGLTVEEWQAGLAKFAKARG